MLYRLSYASKLRDRILSDANLPTDPFQMTGTILKGTINGKRRATNPLARVNPSKSSTSHPVFLIIPTIIPRGTQRSARRNLFPVLPVRDPPPPRLPSAIIDSSLCASDADSPSRSRSCWSQPPLWLLSNFAAVHP